MVQAPVKMVNIGQIHLPCHLARSYYLCWLDPPILTLGQIHLSSLARSTYLYSWLNPSIFVGQIYLFYYLARSAYLALRLDLLISTLCQIHISCYFARSTYVATLLDPPIFVGCITILHFGQICISGHLARSTYLGWLDITNLCTCLDPLSLHLGQIYPYFATSANDNNQQTKAKTFSVNRDVHQCTEISSILVEQ